MKIITSQSFRDDEIVERKKQELIESGTKEVILPVVNIYMDDLYILVDGHHTFTAARELGLKISFEEVEDETTYYQDVEDRNTDAILEAHYMDSDYRYLKDDTLVF